MLGSAVGRDGYLYVVQDVDTQLRHLSTVEFISGESDDVTHYLVSSEQTPSALV